MDDPVDGVSVLEAPEDMMVELVSAVAATVELAAESVVTPRDTSFPDDGPFVAALAFVTVAFP